MGRAKDESIRQSELYSEAQAIAVEVGAIKECEYHSGTFLDCDDSDATKRAYVLATKRWEESGSGEVQRKELMSAIKTAMDDAGQECYSCEKWRND